MQIIQSGNDFLVVESPRTGRRYGISFDGPSDDEEVNVIELKKPDDQTEVVNPEGNTS